MNTKKAPQSTGTPGKKPVFGWGSIAGASWFSGVPSVGDADWGTHGGKAPPAKSGWDIPPKTVGTEGGPSSPAGSGTLPDASDISGTGKVIRRPQLRGGM